MNKILAFIAAAVVAIVFNLISGVIIAVIAVWIASIGYEAWHIMGVIFNILLSFYVGGKVYKRITRVKENKTEE